MSQPAFDSVATVLSFPFLQQLVVAAFGLNDFAIMGFFVLLDLAGATRSLYGSYSSSVTAVGLWIQDVDNVAKAAAVFAQQVT